MNKKMLAVLALMICAATFASGQSFGFGISFGSTGVYCNYEELVDAGGGLWGGWDNLTNCPDHTYPAAGISGFTATVGTGFSVRGKGVIYGDSIYAVYYSEPVAQWTVFTKLKCNKVKDGGFAGGYGWEGVAAFSGEVAGTGEGPLSCAIPGKNGVVPSARVATSAVRLKDR